MKINPVSEAVRFLNQVREKQDSDGHSRGQQQQTGSDQKQSDEESVPTDELKVNAAIEAFQKDAQTQQHGLSVSRIGQGPGLKVVLKDGNGGVVRQFTGEEFVRLREATSKDGRVSGKILDQKL